MPMGIVSEKEFQTELENSQKAPEKPLPEVLPITGEIKDVNRGRGENSVGVPNSLRNLIGEESITNGRHAAVELGKSFGISPSSVSAYGVGATSTATYKERPNAPAINGVKDKIAKRARGKLMAALHHITNDKLQGANAKDLAGIAKDMSAVVKSMEPDTPKAPGENSNGPTFVFYAPQFHKEEHYDIVHVKE